MKVPIIIAMLIMAFLLGTFVKFEHMQLDEVERVILDVHLSNNYTNGNYTCTNYTKDAITELKRLGYEAYYVAGNKINTNDTHAWVKVCRDYDVTNGIMEPNLSEFTDITMLNETDGMKICPWMESPRRYII